MCRCCGVPFGPGPDAPAPPTGRQGFQLTSLTRGRGPERRLSPLRHGRGVWQAAEDRPQRTPAHARARRPQAPVSTRHRAAGCATTHSTLLFRWPCGDRRAVHRAGRAWGAPRTAPGQAKAGLRRWQRATFGVGPGQHVLSMDAAPPVGSGPMRLTDDAAARARGAGEAGSRNRGWWREEPGRLTPGGAASY